MIDAALYGYLTSQPPVAALIGNRLYPSVLPEEVNYPAVAYMRVSTQRVYGIGGPIGYATPRIQFSVFALDPDTTSTVIDAIRMALDGFHGGMGNVNVREIASDDEMGEHDGGYEPVTKTFQRRIDFYIGHEE